MRLAFAFALGLAGLAAPGSAGAVTVWQGTATVVAATPACSAAASERLKSRSAPTFAACSGPGTSTTTARTSA